MTFKGFSAARIYLRPKIEPLSSSLRKDTFSNTNIPGVIAQKIIDGFYMGIYLSMKLSLIILFVNKDPLEISF